MSADLSAIISRVRFVLRTVDAADHKQPLAEHVTDEVCDAVFAVERFARDNGIKLSEATP